MKILTSSLCIASVLCVLGHSFVVKAVTLGKSRMTNASLSSDEAAKKYDELQRKVEELQVKLAEAEVRLSGTLWHYSNSHPAPLSLPTSVNV